MELKNRITNITCDWKKRKKRLTHLSSEKGPGNLLHKYAAWGDKHIGWESGLLELVVHWQHTGKEQREKWWGKRCMLFKNSNFLSIHVQKPPKRPESFFLQNRKKNNGGSLMYFNDFFPPHSGPVQLFLWKGNLITLVAHFTFMLPVSSLSRTGFLLGKKELSSLELENLNSKRLNYF